MLSPSRSVLPCCSNLGVHTKLGHLHIERHAQHEFPTYSLQAHPPVLAYLVPLPRREVQFCTALQIRLTSE